MKVTKRGELYVCECTFDERSVPGKAGFRWDWNRREQWETTDPMVAAKLIRYADDSVRPELELAVEAGRASIRESMAATAEIDIPHPDGLDYLPYQRACIAYALQRRSVLNADEMGLGKTVETVGFINAKRGDVRRVLIVCPASLKLNWKSELDRWLFLPGGEKLSITVVNGRKLTGTPTDVVIVNYDVLDRHRSWLVGFRWDLIVLDECHFCKSPKAKRTRALLGLTAKYKHALSGTPILNTAADLHPVLDWLQPGDWGNWWSFARRYCRIVKDRFGTRVTGSANESELMQRLRSTVMVRRMKRDVLTELPEKFRQVIELPASGSEDWLSKEWNSYNEAEAARERLEAAVQAADIVTTEAEYAAAVRELTRARTAAFSELSAVRHQVALQKLPLVIAHLRHSVGHDHKIVVFAHHRDVVERIHAEFADCSVAITGETPPEQRHDLVRRFQEDPSVTLFVGNIQAAGVGITLTAASHVVMAELDWVPARLTQAEDRCHRVGQTDNVLVQHLVLEGSLDAVMARRLVRKQQMTNMSLNGGGAAEGVSHV